MKDFDSRVKKMLKLINKICLQRQKKREDSFSDALDEFPKLLNDIPIPNEDLLDFKSSKLELKEFKNYFDHFRK